jgi:hypothetical protein
MLLSRQEEMMTEDAAARLRKRIKKLVRAHPDEVAEALLETQFWPQTLSSREAYQRFGDDDNSFLRIVFSEDGDAWPNVFHLEMEGDKKEMSMCPRYRTYFGGGQSLRTRAALLILAKAIAMDNAERPQRRDT